MTRRPFDDCWPTLRRDLLATYQRAGSVLGAEPHRVSIAVAHLLALVASFITLAVQGQPLGANPQAYVVIGIAIGLAFLRTITVGRGLVTSSLILDALATVIFLAGTGGTESPFYPLALAGAWWAAHAVRSRGILYGVVFAVGYIALIAPMAVRELLVSALYQPVAVVIVASMADQLAALDRVATDLARTAASGVLDGRYQRIRRGLSRALPTSRVPTQALLTAGQLGLTAIQTELLAYLMLGLTNQEIADAAGVSESTVRYRLTPLYRTLGVRGRKAAAERARELGLGDLVAGARESGV
jgi:DNA-binding CsgD family transcriptional regulator